MPKKKTLKGLYVIVYDTICEGHQCVNDGVGPALFNSYAEAMIELFDSALGMLEAQDEEALLELELSKEQIAGMRKVYETKDAGQMEKYLDEHPEMNYNGEFVQPAEEFILGRKAVFTGKGLVITGKKLG